MFLKIADHIDLLASVATELQHTFNIVYGYSNKWKHKINNLNTKVIFLMEILKIINIVVISEIQC